MKKSLLKVIFLLFCYFHLSVHLNAQGNKMGIDTSNYYNFFSSDENIETAHLEYDEIVAIMYEELNNAGFTWLSKYTLFKVDDSTRLVLSVYCRKSNFGFFCIDGFGIPPMKEDRQNLTMKNGAEYRVCEQNVSGTPNFIPIRIFPKNIFVLNQSCYWYQVSSKSEENKNLVTKQIITNILKQDIAAYINKMK